MKRESETERIDREKFIDPECRTYFTAYEKMKKHALILESKIDEISKERGTILDAILQFKKAIGRYNTAIATARLLELVANK